METNPKTMTLEQIAELPGHTLVLRYWQYDGENPEPEVWRRSAYKVLNGEHWWDLTDHDSRYGQKDVDFHSEHALYTILWLPDASTPQ